MPTLTKESVNRVLIWTVATPIITSWALVSFIPMFALFGPENLIDLFVQAAFLATGFVGLLGLLILAAFAKQASVDSPIPRRIENRRAIWLSIWAIGWMTLYGLYALA